MSIALMFNVTISAGSSSQSFDVDIIDAVCEITACQRTFSGQKRCLSGHTNI